MTIMLEDNETQPETTTEQIPYQGTSAKSTFPDKIKMEETSVPTKAITFVNTTDTTEVQATVHKTTRHPQSTVPHFSFPSVYTK